MSTTPENKNTCPCNGKGWTDEHSPGVYDHDADGSCNGSCPVQVRCEDCNGTGLSPERAEEDEYRNLTPREAADKWDKEQESKRVNEAIMSAVRTVTQRASEANTEATRDEDIRWLMSEAWELTNKPWRFFRTMADFIEKHADPESEGLNLDQRGIDEAVAELRRLGDWASEGNYPRAEKPKAQPASEAKKSAQMQQAVVDDYMGKRASREKMITPCNRCGKPYGFYCEIGKCEPGQKETSLEAAAETFEPAQGAEELDFGDYAYIEQKRHGAPNEMYQHKVIGRLKSNSYVDVPVQSPAREVWHEEIVEVVAAITCGVNEREVLHYRLEDVRPSQPAPTEPDGISQCQDCYCMTKTNAIGFCGKCGADKLGRADEPIVTSYTDGKSEPAQGAETELERWAHLFIDKVRWDEDRPLKAGEKSWPEQLTEYIAQREAQARLELLQELRDYSITTNDGAGAYISTRHIDSAIRLEQQRLGEVG